MKASERVYSDLRKRLMTGHYPPRAQLKEQELSVEYDVSRTPVRAALGQLVSEGMLVAEPNRGVFVAEWTLPDVSEVFGLRRLLEAHASGLAAQRHTPAQFAELEEINGRMAFAVEAADRAGEAVVKIQSANNEFHRAILVASGSPRLGAICGALVDTPMIIGSFYLYNMEELCRSVEQHSHIIRAISTHDYEYAFQSMSIHLRATYEIYMSKRLKSGENGT